MTQSDGPQGASPQLAFLPFPIDHTLEVHHLFLVLRCLCILSSELNRLELHAVQRLHLFIKCHAISRAMEFCPRHSAVSLFASSFDFPLGGSHLQRKISVLVPRAANAHHQQRVRRRHRPKSGSFPYPLLFKLPHLLCVVMQSKLNKTERFRH